MSKFLIFLLVAYGINISLGDTFVFVPPVEPGTNDIFDNEQSILPLLPTEAYFTSARYQQIYDRSAFTNVNREDIYVTTVTFYMNSVTNDIYEWTVPSMQVNLSTTTRSPATLSTNFADNVGSDDTIVMGPAEETFEALGGKGAVPIPLDRPFRYNPSLGNLLLDVRVIRGTALFDPNIPALWSEEVSSSQVSSVWSTNVDFTSGYLGPAGVFTSIQFSPIPSITKIYTSYFGTPTNYFAVEWPTQPSAFVLQRSDRLGAQALWQTVTNAGLGSSTPFQSYWLFPVDTAGPSGFYRLVWEPNGPQLRSLSDSSSHSPVILKPKSN